MVEVNGIEKIILRDGHKRGMDILSAHLKENFLLDCAQFINHLKRGVILLTTGFYVNGAAETDGPIGTYFLANTLKEMGFTPIILTDEYCRGFFESHIADPIPTEILSLDPYQCNASISTIMEQYKPVALIAIERCGRNASGKYCNMRNVDIGRHTAPIDELFIKYKTLHTIGMGDGGNEIGMGLLYEIITESLPNIEPASVAVDHLLIGTVSNWIAYGLMGYLSWIDDQIEMPPFSKIIDYMSYINNLGAVDGVLGLVSASTDGYDMDHIKMIYEGIQWAAKDLICVS